MESTRTKSGPGPRIPVPVVLTAALMAAWLGLAGPVEAAETRAAPAARITAEQATAAALRALPGKVTDVTIEKKRGKNVYVIEVVSEKDGAETDVFVDLESGQVLGMDK